MIPAEFKDQVVQSGISFMRSITDAYGTEAGLQLWDTISNTLDPDVKGQIFFALLTGNSSSDIYISSVKPNSNKIEVIKAIRTSTGFGLKEAKDAADLLWMSTPVTLQVDPKNRMTYVQQLRTAGCHI